MSDAEATLSAPSHLSPDELRVAPPFADLPDEALAWIAGHARLVEVEPGAHLFEAGRPAQDMAIVLSGRLRILTEVGGQWIEFAEHMAGAVTGLLPYSRMETFGGRGVAVEPLRVALLHKEHFAEMLRVSPVVGKRLVAIMSDRIRETTHEQQQREKMMALGKLSAGLAHELNNPAAAMRRASAALHERLARLPEVVARLARHDLDPDQLRRTLAVCHLAAEREPAPTRSVLARGEQEDALADWLDAHDVAESWMIAETFADVHITPDDLDEMTAGLDDAAVSDLVAWHEGRIAADRLLDELHAAAGRISELVGSIKEYSHMDRGADREPADVRKGLDNTLTMLGHKLKKHDIRLVRDYAPDLPDAPVYVGELNQVWTNLLDNALDAMRDGGTLRLQAQRDGDYLRVDVTDDGHGIPPDLQSRIFEPFFTTKDVGEGTGLGLDIARRIVTSRHGGTIRVASEPGCTTFTVCLPLEA